MYVGRKPALISNDAGEGPVVEKDPSSDNTTVIRRCPDGIKQEVSRQKEEDLEGRNIKFNPPMSIQRYKEVAKCLNSKEFDNKLVTLVDFGCSDMNFMKFAKRVSGVRQISAVDLDGDTLEQYRERAAPLTADYIFKRRYPLTVTLYQGNIVEPEIRLKGYDAVTAIELIEHLHPEVLERVPSALFGFVRPKVAVLTTPNADFNVLFSTKKQFRHWDHKFEWTRKEFANWCDDIVSQYPAYSFTMHGIGNGPPGSELLGRCSQMAVFRLTDESYRNDPLWLNAGTSANVTTYVQVGTYDHPHRAKLTPQMMISDLLYYVRVLGQRDDEEHPPDEPVDIAIRDLLSIPKLMKIFKTEDAVRLLMNSAAAEFCRQECALVSKGDGRRWYIRYRCPQEETSGGDDDDDSLEIWEQPAMQDKEKENG